MNNTSFKIAAQQSNLLGLSQLLRVAMEHLDKERLDIIAQELEQRWERADEQPPPPRPDYESICRDVANVLTKYVAPGARVRYQPNRLRTSVNNEPVMWDDRKRCFVPMSQHPTQPKEKPDEMP